jgi:hypothetical protein
LYLEFIFRNWHISAFCSDLWNNKQYLCFRKLKNKVILVINWKQLHVDCTALINNVYIRLFSFQGGNTALHMAVARDQIGTVKILLQYKPLYSVPNNVSISIACGAVSITTCKSFLLIKLFSNHWNLYRLGLFSLCIQCCLLLVCI